MISRGYYVFESPDAAHELDVPLFVFEADDRREVEAALKDAVVRFTVGEADGKLQYIPPKADAVNRMTRALCQ